MSQSDPFWKSKVVRAAIISVAGAVCLTGAGVVRDTANQVQELKTAQAVQAERDAHILADLAAIKAKLGVTP